MEQIITKQLREIEKKEKVRIIAAVESGSRAWGFASPDSDYDVRFIYVRKPEDYLRLDKIRDVIEWQLDEVLDINGWDLKKTLQLMHDSNPTVFEWCASPILYKSSDAFIELQKIRSDYFSVKKSLYHYWHMANSNYQTYLQGKEVRIKKYFYVIRPLLAAEWIVKKKTQPPMSFSELIGDYLLIYDDRNALAIADDKYLVGSVLLAKMGERGEVFCRMSDDEMEDAKEDLAGYFAEILVNGERFEALIVE